MIVLHHIASSHYSIAFSTGLSSRSREKSFHGIQTQFCLLISLQPWLALTQALFCVQGPRLGWWKTWRETHWFPALVKMFDCNFISFNCPYATPDFNISSQISLLFLVWRLAVSFTHYLQSYDMRDSWATPPPLIFGEIVSSSHFDVPPHPYLRSSFRCDIIGKGEMREEKRRRELHSSHSLLTLRVTATTARQAVIAPYGGAIAFSMI